MISLLGLGAACLLMLESAPALAQTATPSPFPYCGAQLKLKSWKGDYLHRPDKPSGVTSWTSGPGNEWTIQFNGGNKVKLKSWKGDYLHRPDNAQGVTSWSTAQDWTLESVPATP